MLHLFHPALVHFAVAFIIASGCAEVWGILARREPLRRRAATLVLVGLASLVPVLATGYLAANVLDVPPSTDRLLAAHERNGWILFGLLLATQFGKAWCGGRIPERLRWVYAGRCSSRSCWRRTERGWAVAWSTAPASAWPDRSHGGAQIVGAISGTYLEPTG